METKICSKCGIEKSIEEFHWRNKAQGTRRAECKECHNNQVKKRYDENKDYINALKEGKSCVKCGYNKCAAALDYHHIDPSTKINTVAKLSTHANLKDAIKEIEKCVLLCANCHREFHYLKEKNGINLEDFLN
jgi:hypothetical protein